MGRKKKEAEAVQADATTTTTTETTSEAPVDPQTETAIETEEPAPKKKGKAKKGGAGVPGKTTLADLAAGYLAHMETEGKSDGTISSYRMELKTAAAELGEETLVADLTPERVQEFFDCPRVTKLRSGKAKAKPSIDKTRRVLRLALWWAEERGIVKKAPLPEAEPAK